MEPAALVELSGEALRAHHPALLQRVSLASLASYLGISRPHSDPRPAAFGMALRGMTQPAQVLG
jgi:hypothetical protein